MSKRTVSGIMLTLLFIGMLALAFNIQPVKAEPATIVVPDDYPTIQEAINNANEEDTIYVRSGTYYENVVVNKTVSLIGESEYGAIIDGSGTETVVNVLADDVNITGFAVVNGSVGIKLFSNFPGLSSNIIINNTITTNGIGILLENSGGNIFSSNNITDNIVGMWLDNSSYNAVYHNNFVNNTNQTYIHEPNSASSLSPEVNETASNHTNTSAEPSCICKSPAGKGKVYAQRTMVGRFYINPPKLAAEIGTKFNMSIMIENGEDLYTIDASLGWNPKILNLSSIYKGDYFQGYTSLFLLPAVNYEKGIAKGIVWTLLGEPQGVDGTGSLATVEFEVVSIGGDTIDLYDATAIDFDGVRWGPINSPFDCSFIASGWNSDYPSGGNYWSDHVCTGNPSDGSQPYIIDADNIDHYPFQDPNGWLLHQLTVTSSPITGIPFTINGTPQTTPYTEWFVEGFYTLQMPETHIGYVWSHWLEDGDTNRTKTITLPGTTWTGVFVFAVQPYGPEAEFEAIPDTALTGESVKFDASASSPGWNGTHEMLITEYRWDFGGVIKITTSTPILYYSFISPGICYATLTVYAPGVPPETDSTTHKVTITAIPVGGYMYPIEGHATKKPLMPYLALIAILTVSFTIVKRRKKQQS